MQPNERRFRERFDAAPLKLEIRPYGLLGSLKKPHPAFARNFAIGGISIRTPRKMKAGQHVLLNIVSHYHHLQAIPAIVIRTELIEDEWHCAIKFSLGELSDNVRKVAYSVLQHLEVSLKQQPVAA